MIKKITSILFIFCLFIGSPLSVNAEKLYTNPPLITLETAPHSPKPVSKKKKKSVVRNLKMGMKGSDVTKLQQFLIKKSVGPKAKELAQKKATGNFGQLTKDALIEYQNFKGLPADGVAGSKIRALYNK